MESKANKKRKGCSREQVQVFNECSFIKSIEKQSIGSFLVPHEHLFNLIINSMNNSMLFELANYNDKLLVLVEMKEYEFTEHKLHKNTIFTKLFVVQDDNTDNNSPYAYLVCYADINNLSWHVLQPCTYTDIHGKYYEDILKNNKFTKDELRLFINTNITRQRLIDDLKSSYQKKYDIYKRNCIISKHDVE